MTVELTNTDLANGALAAYEAFALMIDGLDDAAWHTPTRCAGWEVRDVAGHVVGLAADAVAGVPGSRTADEQAAALRDYSRTDLAEQLRASVASLRGFVAVLDHSAWNGPSGVAGTTLAQGVLGLWFDTYVHADDVGAALGREPDRGPGLEASVVHLARRLTARGWGPATLALDGMPTVDVGKGGRHIIGDPHQFVLVATGRADAAAFGLDARVNVFLD